MLIYGLLILPAVFVLNSAASLVYVMMYNKELILFRNETKKWISLCVRECVSLCAILYHLLLLTLYLSCLTPWPQGPMAQSSAMTFDLRDVLLGPR